MRFDMAIVNANLHPVNETYADATALGVLDDKIVLLGSDSEVEGFIGRGTELVNAGGRVVLPGFVDGHTHFSAMGVEAEKYLNLRSVRSKKALLEGLEEFASTKEKGEWIIGTGWDESKWSDSDEFPPKEELDRHVPHNPVALRRVDCHLYCLNSMALRELDLDPSTRGFETADGEPTGIVTEDTANLVSRKTAPDGEDLVQGLEEAMLIAHKNGVTSIHQMVVDEYEFRDNMNAYQQLMGDGKLKVRSRLYFTENYLDELIDLGVRSGFGNDTLSIGGLKLFLDGSIGAKTAWVRDGYKGEPRNHGISMWKKEELLPLVNSAHQHGIQMAIHAIGDGAVAQAVEVLGEVVSPDDSSSLPHRVEHCELITEDQIKKLRSLGVACSMQPNFIGEWGLPGGLYTSRFGSDSLRKLNPLRRVYEGGKVLSFGSDGMPFGPLYGIHWAVNGPFENQQLSPEQAVRAYTRTPASIANRNPRTGSLAPGNYADIAILDGDPFEFPEQIKDMEVVATIFGGEAVYKG